MNKRLLPDTATRSNNGHLYLGGCDTVELARQYGTPLYVYDETTLHRAARQYHDALNRHYPAESAVAYASKAYLCTALAQFWARSGLELDVVGPGELETALNASFPVRRIHLHGNNKPLALLARAIEVGLGRIVIDGDGDFENLDALAPTKPVKTWLRLSPGIDAHTHDYRNTGLLDSKFGFPIATGDAERAVARALRAPEIELVGLHAHIGSQILDPAPLVACAKTLIQFAAQMRDRHGWVATEISTGGGWGVPYTLDQPELLIEQFTQSLCENIITECTTRQFPLPRLVLEPGRSLVAQAGVALYTAGRHKVVPGKRVYVALDGGLADNPRPALYGTRYTALCANREGNTTETVTLCGPFCESGDILVRDVSLPALNCGDIVVIPVSGAYHLSMASTYNGFPRPAVVWVADAKPALIQRRETTADLISRDLPIESFAEY
ncbi:MAG: diaminopimelate decarboxylase [Anaerolineae bacterium]|nr:diaminopimelate decarboxylase [Anaerolineae bacterium]